MSFFVLSHSWGPQVTWFPPYQLGTEKLLGPPPPPKIFFQLANFPIGNKCNLKVHFKVKRLLILKDEAPLFGKKVKT